MDGQGLMIIGLILNVLFTILGLINEDFVLGIGIGMFVVAVGAIKFGKEEGLI